MSASKVDKEPWEARIASLGRTRDHTGAFGWVVGRLGGTASLSPGPPSASPQIQLPIVLLDSADAVGKSLSLAVSDTQLRIFEGTALRVTHRRSYDQGRRIEDPSHQEALLALKRKARGGVASARLLSVAPESEAFLDAAFLKGEHIGSLVQKLTRLLDDYGDRRFKAALAEALERGTPRASSVAYLLERRRRSERSRTPLPVDLSRRPDLADLVVTPHEGGTYDQLSRRRSDDPEE